MATPSSLGEDSVEAGEEGESQFKCNICFEQASEAVVSLCGLLECCPAFLYLRFPSVSVYFRDAGLPLSWPCIRRVSQSFMILHYLLGHVLWGGAGGGHKCLRGYLHSCQHQDI